MNRCANCRIDFPDFMSRCPSCNESLPRADDYKPLATQVLYFAQAHSSLGMRNAMRKKVYELTQGRDMPTADEVSCEIRQKLRIQCELFYEQYQQAIHPYYDREQIDRYFRQYLTDDVTPSEFESRARELIRMLNSYVRKAADQEKRLREQEEEERRRQDALEEERRWERERAENERMMQLREDDIQLLVDESRGYRNEIATHSRFKDKIMAILNNHHVDAETKLMAIRGLLCSEPGDELFDHNSLEAHDL